jgi:hypothetical protein
MLLVATTWVGTHRTISNLESGHAAHPDMMHPAEGWAARDGHLAAAAHAAVAPAVSAVVSGGATIAPGPGDANAAVTSGAALSRVFGALSNSWGAHSTTGGGAAGGAAAAAALPSHGGAAGAVGLLAAAGADAVAMAGAALADSERDIELRPERVAAVVGRAKAAEMEQLLQRGAAEGAGAEMRVSMDSAEKYQVGGGTGGVSCTLTGLVSCLAARSAGHDGQKAPLRRCWQKSPAHVCLANTSSLVQAPRPSRRSKPPRDAPL